MKLYDISLQIFLHLFLGRFPHVAQSFIIKLQGFKVAFLSQKLLIMISFPFNCRQLVFESKQFFLVSREVGLSLL